MIIDTTPTHETTELTNAGVANEGMVSVTDGVKVDVLPNAEAAPSYDAEEFFAVASVTGAYGSSDVGQTEQDEATLNSSSTGGTSDAVPSNDDVDPLEQKLKRLRADCIVLGAEAASEQTVLDNDAKTARERQSAFTDKASSHFEAVYAYGIALQDLAPEALKSHLCELKMFKNGKRETLKWRKDYAANPFIPLMASSNSALSGGRLSIRATSALYASKLDVPVSEVIQFIDGDHDVEESGEIVSRSGLMACYAVAKIYFNSNSVSTHDADLKRMQADLRKHPPLFQVKIDPTNFPVGVFTGVILEMTDEGELRGYGSSMRDPAQLVSAIKAVKAVGFAQAFPLYPLYQAIEAANLLTEARYLQQSHAFLKDQPRYMLIVRSGEGAEAHLHVAFGYQKQQPTLYCRLPNILPDLPTDEVYYILPEAQQVIRARLQAGNWMELEVPRSPGLHIKLTGASDEAPILLEHSAGIIHPVRLVVGSKRTIWPMPFCIDEAKREHLLAAYRLLKAHRKQGASLKSPFVWITQWDDDGFWRLSLDLSPVSISADIMKMEVKPEGEHKDREFSASHIDRFLQASKKLQLNDVHGQVFDRELVLNATWGDTDLSFVIPTNFPSQFEHNGRDITHQHDRYWEVGYVED